MVKFSSVLFTAALFASSVLALPVANIHNRALDGAHVDLEVRGLDANVYGRQSLDGTDDEIYAARELFGNENLEERNWQSNLKMQLNGCSTKSFVGPLRAFGFCKSVRKQPNPADVVKQSVAKVLMIANLVKLQGKLNRGMHRKL